MIEKLTRAVGMIGGAALAVALMAVTGTADAQERYSMAASSPTGGYYRLFAPAAEYINKNSELLRFTPLSTDGSLENCRRVNGGGVKFGMCTMVDLPSAWQGSGPFQEPQRNLRILGPDLQPIVIYFMVRADSDVRTIEDLEGESFGCGAPGSATTQVCQRMLEALGLTEKVDNVELPFDQLTDMMANRDIVGTARGAIGMPASFPSEVNARVPIRVIDLSDVVARPEVMSAIPAASATPIPDGAYEFIPGGIQTVSIRSFFIAHKDVPDEHVTEFLRVVNSEGMNEHMASAFPAHNFYPQNQDPLSGIPFPLHPAAEKFWKETGVEMHEPALTE